MKKIERTCLKTDLKFCLNDIVDKNYIDLLYLDNDDEITITIQKKKDKRSKEQNSYYWGAVIPFIHQLGVFPQLKDFELDYKIEYNDLQIKVSEIYNEMLKHEFNYILGTGLDGKIKRILVSTKNLTKIKFSNFTQRINNYLLENFGMEMPSSEEYDEWIYHSKKDSQPLDFIIEYINTARK